MTARKASEDVGRYVASVDGVVFRGFIVDYALQGSVDDVYEAGSMEPVDKITKSVDAIDIDGSVEERIVLQRPPETFDLPTGDGVLKSSPDTVRERIERYLTWHMTNGLTERQIVDLLTEIYNEVDSNYDG